MFDTQVELPVIQSRVQAKQLDLDDELLRNLIGWQVSFWIKYIEASARLLAEVKPEAFDFSPWQFHSRFLKAAGCWPYPQ